MRNCQHGTLTEKDVATLEVSFINTNLFWVLKSAKSCSRSLVSCVSDDIVLIIIIIESYKVPSI